MDTRILLSLQDFLNYAYLLQIPKIMIPAVSLTFLGQMNTLAVVTYNQHLQSGDPVVT